MEAICIYPNKISRLVTNAHICDGKPCKRWDTPVFTTAPPKKKAHAQGTSRFCVTVDRRITPPTAASERSMIVSCHAAPQCADACHAYQPGDTLRVPGSSHHGNVHVRLGGWYNASSVGLRCYDQPPAGHHVGSTVHSKHSARAVFLAGWLRGFSPSGSVPGGDSNTPNPPRK